MLFERPESMKTSKDLFAKLRHIYYDFGGVEFLEDGMRAILETIAPEQEEMDEGTREEVMGEGRAIYREDDSVLESFMYEPVEVVSIVEVV